MPTKNRRVATYLPDWLIQAFDNFKSERKIGDSQALITILSDFFQVGQSVAQPVTHSSSLDNLVTQEQFQELVTRFDELSKRFNSGELLGELKDELLRDNEALSRRIINLESRLADVCSSVTTIEQEYKSELPSEPESESTRALSNQLSLLVDTIQEQLEVKSDEVGVDSELVSELLTDLPDNSPVASTITPLSRAEFAKRIQRSAGGVAATIHHYHKKIRDPDKLIDWSRERDPDHVGWRYDEGDKRFHPVPDQLPNS
jgi:hypothetical protein